MKRKYLFLLMAAALVMGFAACSEEDDDEVVPNIDLSTVTSDLTLQNGDVVTGKLKENVKISIADGATVTFKGDTIKGAIVMAVPRPGITCRGDATIILADGTVNVVSPFGDYYPGIYVPLGKTLIIRGNTGELRVRGSHAAAIGGGSSSIGAFGETIYNDNVNCGNIRIEGGVIKAYSSKESAAIGAGTDAKCGDITIMGGTISANSTDGPAIGSVSGGSCGKIVITGGNITAKSTWNQAPAIGSSGWLDYDKSGKSYGKFESITITSGITSLIATGGDGSTVPPIGKGADDTDSGDVNIDGKQNPDASWTGDGMKSLKLTKPDDSNNIWQLER